MAQRGGGVRAPPSLPHHQCDGSVNTSTSTKSDAVQQVAAHPTRLESEVS